MIKSVINANFLEKNTIYKFKLKILRNIKLKPKTKSYQQALPFVSVPLLAYNVQSDAKARGKAIALEHGKANHTITDNTEKNIKALKKVGYKNVDINRELDKHGNLKNESTKKAIASKGAPDDLDAQPAQVDEYYTGDLPPVYDDNLPDDTTLPEDVSLTEDLTNFSDLGDSIDVIPVAGAIVAETLPGTKFFKPIKDLYHGDVEKTAVGTLSRATETLIAPIKLLYVGSMGLCSSLFKLAGMEDNEDENERFVGFWNGVKLASRNWAEGRDEIEDIILGRETKSERKARLEEELRKKIEEREAKIIQLQKERAKRAEALKQKRLEQMRKEQEIHKRETLQQSVTQKKDFLEQKLSRPYGSYSTRFDKKNDKKEYKICKLKERIYSLLEQCRVLKIRNFEKFENLAKSDDINVLNELRKDLQRKVM